MFQISAAGKYSIAVQEDQVKGMSQCHEFGYDMRQVHLRNKFHFSEVHGSLNATGHVHKVCGARRASR